MTAHLLLLCHAATASTRSAGFPPDEEVLDPAAAARLGGLRGRLRHTDRRYVRPMARAKQTAAALGLDAVVESALADCDFGRWRGHSLLAVQKREPQSVAEWLRDPTASPHGGESVVSLIERVGAWLGSHGSARGVTLAITHASNVRAAIVAALEAEARAFWRVDVAPLTLVRLSGHGGRWNLVDLGALEAEI